MTISGGISRNVSEVLIIYSRFKFRDGDAGIQGGCDEACQREILCDVAKAQFGDYTQCNYFTELYGEGK